VFHPRPRRPPVKFWSSIALLLLAPALHPLLIPWRLATAMGGTLTARNRSGSGAEFELRIPIRQNQAATTPAILDQAVVA
jgi:hypothetical protein